MYSSILLFSGGIDSYLAYHYIRENLDKDVHLLYYNLGSKYSKQELDHIKNLDFFLNKGEVIETIRLGDLEHEDSFIPNRNILMATHATAFTDHVWIGGTLSDRVGDNKKEVFDDLSTLLSKVNDRMIKIRSPFWNFYKEEVTSYLVHTVKLVSQEQLVTRTFSCYKPIRERAIRIITDKGKSEYLTTECLVCKACFRKGAALFSAGVTRPFYNKKIVNSYLNDFNNRLYSPRREWTLKYCNYLRSELIN